MQKKKLFDNFMEFIFFNFRHSIYFSMRNSKNVTIDRNVDIFFGSTEYFDVTMRQKRVFLLKTIVLYFSLKL